MAVNAINGNSEIYTGYYNSAARAKDGKTEENKAAVNEKNDVAAVYEKSDNKVDNADQKKIYKPDQAI